jgi:hypothetical protein
MTLIPTNDPPHDLPSGVDDHGDADVQRVRVVRSGELGEAGTVVAGGEPAVASVSSIGRKAGAVLGSGKSAFFATFKWTALFGLLLAVVTAWYVSNKSALRDVVVVLLVLIPSVGVAVALAAQRAASALAVETWRQTGLIGRVLDTLLDRVARQSSDFPANADNDGPAFSEATLPPLGVLPLPEANGRLRQATESWVAKSDAPRAVGGGFLLAGGGLVGRAQRWIAGLVERVTLREFRRTARDGQVDLAAVRAGLIDRVDDLVAVRVRTSGWSAVSGAVLALLAWAALVALAVSRLWS